MVHGRVVLGKVVSFVCGTRPPEDVILALPYTVPDPIKTHVDGLGPFLFDVVIGNARGCGIVSLYGRGGLGMPEFLQGDAQRASMLGIEEQGAQFCFCGTGGLAA